MVTDVQGWYDEERKVAVLTDPCTHCTWQGLMDAVSKDSGLVGEPGSAACGMGLRL